MSTCLVIKREFSNSYCVLWAPTETLFFCFFEIVSLYRHVWAGIHCIDQTIPKLSSCLPSVEVTGMYYYTQLGLSVVDLIFSTLFA